MNTITVPFHNDELLIVEYNGQPFTPMKPIVDSMGLDWASQFVKIKQRFISTIVEITIVANDGKERLMTCIPIRKLPAWLYSIHANKVKPELRDKVIMYQTECDDVLWEYWTKGQAINERKTINQEQQDILSCTVEDRAKGDKKVEKKIWSQLHRHFKIKDFRELLAIHYLDAVRFLHHLEINVSIGHAQIPLLPMPLQQGRFLVVCDGEQVTIHDVADYDCIKKGTMQKFYDDQKKVYLDLCNFILDPFLDSMRIKQRADKLPVVGKFKRA